MASRREAGDASGYGDTLLASGVQRVGLLAAPVQVPGEWRLT